ncbi:hypothetical protein AALO_G00119760 [Alosa alosa]|uniref:Uncharacterized protein n=1 Tax=Alosa alosa TaxID=278164 RepID=A0AAV6GPT8_9TELE|nr:hypothetical protein AALO_G00119760 [Alosa alosa]
MTSVPEPEEGILIKLKFSDGRLQRRRFETHQDLVAFAGMDDMSSEVFSLQLAMSPTPILSTSTGTLADNGIHESCTMYVLWMAGHEVEEVLESQRSPIRNHVVDVTSNEVDAWVMLKHLKSKIDFTSSPSANLVNVCRDDVLGCAIRAFQRPLFDPCRKVDIIFVDDWDLRCGG